MNKVTKNSLPKDLVEVLVEIGLLKKFLYFANKYPKKERIDVTEYSMPHPNKAYRYIDGSSVRVSSWSEWMYLARLYQAIRLRCPINRITTLNQFTAYCFMGSDKEPYIMIGCMSISFKDIFEIYNLVKRGKRTSFQADNGSWEINLFSHGDDKHMLMYDWGCDDDDPTDCSYAEWMDVYTYDIEDIANHCVKFNRFWRNHENN